jgi:alpha-tubulin suppressor-like RCC1 family protein
MRKQLLLTFLAGAVATGQGFSKQIAAGYHFSLGIGANGTVYAWGDNEAYQLGNTNADCAFPKAINPAVTNFSAVAAGNLFSLALSNGFVYAWGTNGTQGRLGAGIPNLRTSNPVRVSNLNGITAIAAGESHSLALSNGYVYSWGMGTSGRLGNGGTTSAPTPVQVTNIDGAVAIAAGYDYSLALLSNGLVMAWGAGANGRLGNGADTNSSVPVQVANLTDVVAIAASMPVVTNDSSFGERPHSLALKSDGTVWAWGQNGSYGRLGTGTTTGYTNLPVQVQFTNSVFITNIAVGGTCSFAVNSNGMVYAWGNNDWGQFGDGRHANQGQNEILNSPYPTPVTNLTDVREIVAGRYHTIAIKSNDDTVLCGLHSSGQLGTGEFDYEPKPVSPAVSNVIAFAAGESTSYVVLSNGHVKAWGNADRGRLGNQEPLTGSTGKSVHDHIGTPTDVFHADGSLLTNVVAIAGGAFHALALRNDGTVVGWGENSIGVTGASGTRQLGPTAVFGFRTNAAIQIPNLANVSAIGAGKGHSVALSNGCVYTWGDGGLGQLGNGGWGVTDTPVKANTLNDIVNIAVTGGHNLALGSNGIVWAWGLGTAGQLGHGAGTNCNVPIQVLNLSNVTAIAAGGYHSLAVSNNEVWGWGLKDNGRLGVGGSGSQATPIRITNSLSYLVTNVSVSTTQVMNGIVTNYIYDFVPSTNSSSGDSGPNSFSVSNCIEYGIQVVGYTLATNLCSVTTYTTNVSTNTMQGRVVAVAAGADYSLALTQDGRVFAWGNNGRGATGNGGIPGTATIVPTLVQNSTGTGCLTGVVAIGVSRFDGEYSVDGITQYYRHSMALLDDGTVVTWGDAKEGQPGNGNTGYNATPVLLGPALP